MVLFTLTEEETVIGKTDWGFTVCSKLNNYQLKMSTP